MSSTREPNPARSGESTLLCPRCVSQMLPMQRFGVTIDQCTGCGGIYLDQGELEQLAQAEARFYAQQQPPVAPTYPQYPQQQSGYYGPPRGGFLSGLFGEPHHGRGHHGGHH